VFIHILCSIKTQLQWPRHIARTLNISSVYFDLFCLVIGVSVIRILSGLWDAKKHLKRSDRECSMRHCGWTYCNMLYLFMNWRKNLVFLWVKKFLGLLFWIFINRGGEVRNGNRSYSDNVVVDSWREIGKCAKWR
jgi:hypothetical protein